MQSKAATVDEYLAALPADRRAALAAIRRAILPQLDAGFEEGMQYGMIGYYVPHHVYPAGYHCDPRQPVPFAALASQKNHLALYLMSIYADSAEERWLLDAWAKTGKKLDRGKSCIRFKRLEDLPLDVVARFFRRSTAKKFLATYERALAGTRGGSAASKPSAARKTAKAARRAAAQGPAKKAPQRPSKKQAPASRPARKKKK
ncbi:MAG: DUF1801 domain-containing protein [Pirellulales bacterium]|nr:DUF1801 domain-containing protein [Pirellulales bacterium]